MANFAQITEWAIQNKQALNLSATRVAWTDEFLPAFSDYEVRIKVEGVCHIGRGIDVNESLAFEKATTEALERAAVYLLSPEICVGFAGHDNYESAKLAAYHELLQVDRVLCHHYGRMPYSPIPTETLEERINVPALQKKLKKYGLALKLFSMRPTSDALVATAIIHFNGEVQRSKGFIAGFGASKDMLTATSHAVLECLREAVAVFIGNKTTAHPVVKLEKDANPEWHFWMTQTESSLHYLENNLLPTSDSVSSSLNDQHEDVSYAGIDFTKLDFLESIFPNIPVCIARARSEKLIVPQFGHFILSDHNRNRIKQFSKTKEIHETDIPHFYG